MATIGDGLLAAGQGIAGGIEKRRENKLANQQASQKTLMEMDFFDSITSKMAEGVDTDSTAISSGKELLKAAIAKGTIGSKEGISLFKDLQESGIDKALKDSQLKKLQQDVSKGSFEQSERELGLEDPLSTLESKTKLAQREAEKKLDAKVEKEGKVSLMQNTLKSFGTQVERAKAIRTKLEEKYLGFNKADMTGNLIRMSVGAINAMAKNEPELNAYMTRLRKQAVTVAREIEGGKVTNQDMENILLTLQNPLGASAIEDLYKAKYDLEDWIDQDFELKDEYSKFLENINSQIAEAEAESGGTKSFTFNTVEEAEAAKLPAGTVVTVAGRKAKVT